MDLGKVFLTIFCQAAQVRNFKMLNEK